MPRDISLSYTDGSTLTGADAILQQYEIALFTIPTEFSPDPTFGIGIETYLGEANSPVTAKAIKQRIVSFTRDQFPEIAIRGILITRSQTNQINVQLDIMILPYGERRVINKDVTAT